MSFITVFNFQTNLPLLCQMPWHLAQVMAFSTLFYQMPWYLAQYFTKCHGIWHNISPNAMVFSTTLICTKCHLQKKSPTLNQSCQKRDPKRNYYCLNKNIETVTLTTINQVQFSFKILYNFQVILT